MDRGIRTDVRGGEELGVAVALVHHQIPRDFAGRRLEFVQRPSVRQAEDVIPGELVIDPEDFLEDGSVFQNFLQPLGIRCPYPQGKQRLGWCIAGKRFILREIQRIAVHIGREFLLPGYVRACRNVVPGANRLYIQYFTGGCPTNALRHDRRIGHKVPRLFQRHGERLSCNGITPDLHFS